MMRRKLKSENGASLALALLFFVICAMVGSVVLAAATAAAGRIANLQKSDQARYTLESAADLIESQLTGWSYVRTGTTSESEQGKVKSPGDGEPYTMGTGGTLNSANCMSTVFYMSEQLSNYRWKEDGVTRAGYGSDPGEVMNAIKDAVAEAGIKNQTASGDYKKPVIITLNGSSDLMLPVYAVLMLGPDYTVYVDLHVCKKTKNSGELPYQTTDWDLTMPSLMMTFDADFTETTGVVLRGSKQVEKTDVNVTWLKPVIIMNEKRA